MYKIIVLIAGCSLFIIQIMILIFTNIDLKKRRIFLILDFLAISLLFAAGVIFPLYLFLPFLVLPAMFLYFIIYNILIFKIVRRIILRTRAERIKEEISDALIESLRSLAEFDHYTAYQILEQGLRKHPDSLELKNLKKYLDHKVREINPRKKRQISDRD